DKLISQTADKKKIQVSANDMEKELEEIKKSFPSVKQFQAALAQSGMSEEQLKEELKTKVQIEKIFETEIKVSDEEIKKYYDENKERYSTPEQVKASHILVKTKEEADNILRQLKEGSDFSKLAKEKSGDPGTKEQGGDLGYFSPG
ncbi:peptidylprolyl isomerase, partial [Escherichia coli]